MHAKQCFSLTRRQSERKPASFPLRWFVGFFLRNLIRSSGGSEEAYRQRGAGHFAGTMIALGILALRSVPSVDVPVLFFLGRVPHVSLFSRRGKGCRVPQVARFRNLGFHNSITLGRLAHLRSERTELQ